MSKIAKSCDHAKIFVIFISFHNAVKKFITKFSFPHKSFIKEWEGERQLSRDSLMVRAMTVSDKVKKQSQETFTCSKSTIETIEKGV